MKSLKAILAGLFLVGCSSSVTYHTIDAKEAKSMIENQEVVIVDVREESEYKSGHIKDSILIPLSTIDKDNTSMPKTNQTVLIYCRSGNRSAKAAKKFSALGYQNVYNFGGINDWTYDIEK